MDSSLLLSVLHKLLCSRSSRQPVSSRFIKALIKKKERPISDDALRVNYSLFLQLLDNGSLGTVNLD